MIRFGFYPCSLGTLVIGYTDDAIVSVKLETDQDRPHCPSPLTDFAAAQIEEYFQGTRKDFDLPVCATGTAFQMAVWQEMRQIPYGETRTYGQIAEALGNPKASRAVGQAANRNPLWILIPCHRVVGKSGNLAGYAGGISMKQALLELEQTHKNTPEA